MTEIESRVYEHFKTDKKYNFSKDVSVKRAEVRALKNLELNGCITVKLRTIAYVIAEISK